MTGSRVLRRCLAAGAMAVVLALPAVVLGPAVASAAVRITNASATPSWVSRYVTPKRVAVRFKQSAGAYVTVKVTTSSGAVVKTLLNYRYRGAGYHVVYWDLKKSTGTWASNSSYTIRIYAKSGGHAGSPYPARVYAKVDSTKPTGSITSVVPSAISASQGQTTTITYRLSDNYTTTKLGATLQILNPAGTVVRSIVATDVTQGSGRTFAWNGRTDAGVPMASGTYSVRVRVQDPAGNAYYSAIGFATKVYLSSWSRERPLDLTAWTQIVTRAETRDDVTHVVWNDASPTGDRIRYRRVDKYGNTVIAPVVVATATFSLTSDDERGVADVSADASGGAYVVWRSTGRSVSYRGIWLARIDPAGRVLWTKRVLDETGEQNILDPRVSASASGLVHVVCWKTSFPSAIYYASFRSDGNEFVGWTTLASGVDSGQRKLPNVLVDTIGRVHVAWYDAIDHPGTLNTGKREIYYTRLVYTAGYVAGGSISKRRLTTTTNGYSPTYGEAPEMAEDDAGAIHVAWPDDESATSSKGIRYLKLNAGGAIVVASKLLFDGSSTAASPRNGNNQAIAPLPGGRARVVYRAAAGLTSPDRLWQIDVGATGIAGSPFCITTSGGSANADAEDNFPSLGTDSGGITHLVYTADTGAPVSGSYRHRVAYKDLAADPASNDVLRGDLQIDAAHVVHASSPAPPRQNTRITVRVDVRNAGWAPLNGGTATLWFEGVPVDTSIIDPISVESTTLVELQWRVPYDATRTPAPLVVSVAPLAGANQTASTNDTASVPLDFLVPPTETTLLVAVRDETRDLFRTGAYWVPTPTVTLSGTTSGGSPYTAVGEAVGPWVEFLHVPLGTYTVSHTKAGYIVSPPASLAVTIARHPGDPYVLDTVPGNLIQLWMNQWCAVEGTVYQSGETTHLAGVTLTMPESDTTSVTAGSGFYRFAKLTGGPVTIRVTKRGFERQILTPTIPPATTLTLDVPMVATTTGYLVGAITDEGGYPIINDPNEPGYDPQYDPRVKVKRSGSTTVSEFHVPTGRFDIRLPEGAYTLEFSASGYKTVTGVARTLYGGEETDASTALDLNVGALTHKNSPERWTVSWTMHANWFGTQPPAFKNALPLGAFNIKQWNGLFRQTFNTDYQRRGTQDYIVYVKPRFIGEAWEWTYFYGIDPPVAPLVFEYGQDFTGKLGKYEPPMLSEGNPWNRSGVRVDGIDIVDQRDWAVVSAIRSSWNSCDEPDGHLYGSVTGAARGDQAFPAYTKAVPWNQQVVRLWMTAGYRDEDSGKFVAAPFADLSSFNQGQLMQASGYNRLCLYWRPIDNYMWVEPALVDYPEPSY